MLTTGSKIRLAQPGDEPEVINLIRVMHAESGMFALDVDRVRETLAKTWNRKGGMLAVIGPPGSIRAMLLLEIGMAWYSRDSNLTEIFCWVHPDHRRSDYAKILIEYAKKCSDDISARHGSKVPLIMGVLTNSQMAAKVRLYRRFFGIPVGAFFLHNASWVKRQEPAEEDFWRIPSMAKFLRRRSERDERRRVAV